MNREDFEILKEQVHGRELVYLDNAATSQKPRQVVEAIVEAYSHWNSNIHRGVHHLSQVATAHHEQARQAVADFIGAKSAKEIIFTKGTTDSINTLAFSIGEMQVNGQPYIQECDEIIVSGVEHHSNIVPWQMLCERKKAVLRHVPLKEDLSFDIEAFKGLLSDKTRLVSVAHVSNVLGIIQPVEEIIFTKGTTDSINTLAFSIGELKIHEQPYIQEGDEIIVSGVEHHSNIVPWQMLCGRKKAVLKHVPLKEDLSFDIEAFKGLLSEKTKLVSVAHVSNVLGIIQPVEEIIRLAHEKGVPVCIDGAQSVPHMQVNVQALDCEFMAFSGHKMYGPTGIGVLYGKKEWLEQLPPAEGGGEMIDHVRWEGTTYNTLPYKFEAGTPNFVGSYALHKAIEYMQSIGWKAIEAHEKELTEYCEERLKGLVDERMNGLEGIHIYAAGQPKAGVISFNVYNALNTQLSTLNTQHSTLIHPFDVGTLLDQQGVAVRTGHHCAEPLIYALGVPGTVRVSFGLYNDKHDVDAFIAALQKALMMLLG